MIVDFLGNGSPTLLESPSETRRFGFRVSRLSVPIGSPFSDEEISGLITSSNSELVIVRASAKRENLPIVLGGIKGATCIHADNLVYYQWTLNSASSLDVRMTGVSTSLNKSFESVVDVLRRSFNGYKNHYSANSRLSQFVTTSAYEEWASEVLKQKSSRMYVSSSDKNGESIGFVLLTIWETEHLAEVVLNAVRPDAHRNGIYTALMRTCANDLASLGTVDTLYISTQRENLAVVSAWEKLGLRPYAALNTFHVMRDDPSAAAIERNSA